MIQLFMTGGASPMDTYDYKPALERFKPFFCYVQTEGEVLTILPAGLPYARTISALLDPYRQDSLRRFSSAV